MPIELTPSAATVLLLAVLNSVVDPPEAPLFLFLQSFQYFKPSFKVCYPISIGTFGFKAQQNLFLILVLHYYPSLSVPAPVQKLNTS